MKNISKDRKEYFRQYYQEHKLQRDKKHQEYNNTPYGRAYYLANRHKQEDARKHRENNINAKWIVDYIFNSKCIYCGETDWTKLGCDRINNSIGHVKNNVVCCCGKCNIERHEKTFYEFYLQKQQQQQENQ